MSVKPAKETLPILYGTPVARFGYKILYHSIADSRQYLLLRGLIPKRSPIEQFVDVAAIDGLKLAPFPTRSPLPSWLMPIRLGPFYFANPISSIHRQLEAFRPKCIDFRLTDHYPQT